MDKKLDSLAWSWVQAGYNNFQTEEDAEIGRQNFKDDVRELLDLQKAEIVAKIKMMELSDKPEGYEEAITDVIKSLEE